MEKFEHKTMFTDSKGLLGGKVDQSAFQSNLNEVSLQGWECMIESCGRPIEIGFRCSHGG